MKKTALITLVTVFFISFKAISQTSDSLTKNGEKVFTLAEKEATFPGGMEGWRKYLEANLNANLAAKYIKLKKGQKFGEQTVIVQFIVDKAGNVSDVAVRNPKEVHHKLGEEAVRVIKEGPKWQPAVQNNKKVIYQALQYVTFQVAEE